MRYLIFFCALFAMALPAQAAPKDRTAITLAAAKALNDYCFAALKQNQDIAAFAAQKGLVEFSAEQAIKFAPDGGRVFAVPAAMGDAVLMTNKAFASTMCAVAMREISPEILWDSIDKYFNASSGFALMREKRVDEDRITKKEYASEQPDTHYTLLITASDSPRPGGMQALATLARVGEKP